MSAPKTIVDERMFSFMKSLKDLGIIDSRQEFADAIGLSKQGLYNVSKGIGSFTIEQITKTCETFGANANYLLGLEATVMRKVTLKKE